MENENQTNTPERSGILPDVLIKEAKRAGQIINSTHYNDDLDRSHKVQQLTDSLNDKFLGGMIGTPFDCIGFARFGTTEDEHLDESEGIVEFSGYIYNGFVAKRPHGHSSVEILLEFVKDIDPEELQTENDVLACYIDPSDFLVFELKIDPNVEFQNLLDRLSPLVVKTKSTLRKDEFLFSNNYERTYTLSELHGRIQKEVLNFKSELVRIEANEYIRVTEGDSDSDYLPNETDDPQNKIHKGNSVIYGNIDDCLYFEYAMLKNPESNLDLTTDNLIFDEPCMVIVSDTEEGVKYFIPVSKVNSIKSEDDIS